MTTYTQSQGIPYGQPQPQPPPPMYAQPVQPTIMVTQPAAPVFVGGCPTCQVRPPVLVPFTDASRAFAHDRQEC